MKIKVADVTAQAFSRADGTPIGVARTETIDVDNNELFQGCDSVLSIKTVFERFWNNLNPNSEEIVFVQRIDTVLTT